MPEYGLAIALHMLVEPNARADPGQDHFERGLAAFEGIAPKVRAAYRFWLGGTAL